jgi:hypothetical protein
MIESTIIKTRIPFTIRSRNWCNMSCRAPKLGKLNCRRPISLVCLVDYETGISAPASDHDSDYGAQSTDPNLAALISDLSWTEHLLH